ncbi:MAG: threonine-phosphate decarboxylase CobD [Thermodesulfovibrionales bacterium]|nr:threonine-phosphate decarboxylase CobD [Thermodesulfovibrionales bacterium]
MPEVYGYKNTIESKIEIHGGNIYRLAEELGVDESSIIDFSASINPLGIPKGSFSAIKDNLLYLKNYPDPDTTRLRKEIADVQNIDRDTIICGNGSTELIYLIIRALRPEKMLIPVPTFSEYQRAFESIIKDNNPSASIDNFVLWERDNFTINVDEFIKAMTGGMDLQNARKSLMLVTPDLVFLCNPNNPTGNVLSKSDILKIADAAKTMKCYLVVDEAFIDYCDEHSVIREVSNNPYLIVIRSMTKFYALSGLRVGYGVFHTSLINQIKRYKEPWTVNTLAQVAAIGALRDKTYITQTFKTLEEGRLTIEDGFSLLKIKYYPSSTNFYLFRFTNDVNLPQYLRTKGILVRDCSNFIGLDSSYIRIAVKDNRDNMRLLKEIARI